MATANMICAAFALGTAGVAFAGQHSHDQGQSSHRSHDNGGQSDYVAGVVTALGTNSITVKDHHGTTAPYTTTGTTTYFEGKTAASVAVLTVGQEVDLWLTSSAPQTVTKVEIDLMKFEGAVTAVAGNVITILDHGTVTTVDVGTGTTYTSNGAPSTLAAIIVGVRVEGSGLPGSTSSTVNALSVDIVTQGQDHDHGGDHGHGHGHGRH